jgi:Leucine-rich repeat (LRR) protein
MARVNVRSTGLRDFPETITNLTNLVYLFAAYNDLRVLPVAICELKSLSTLDISSNYIDELPASMAAMPALRVSTGRIFCSFDLGATQNSTKRLHCPTRLCQ